MHGALVGRGHLRANYTKIKQTNLEGKVHVWQQHYWDPKSLLKPGKFFQQRLRPLNSVNPIRQIFLFCGNMSQSNSKRKFSQHSNINQNMYSLMLAWCSWGHYQLIIDNLQKCGNLFLKGIWPRCFNTFRSISYPWNYEKYSQLFLGVSVLNFEWHLTSIWVMLNSVQHWGWKYVPTCGMQHRAGQTMFPWERLPWPQQ